VDLSTQAPRVSFGSATEFEAERRARSFALNVGRDPVPLPGNHDVISHDDIAADAMFTFAQEHLRKKFSDGVNSGFTTAGVELRRAPTRNRT
jgi:hypothetical protein